MGPWATFDLGVYMSYFLAILIALNISKKIRIYYLLFIAAFFTMALFGEIKAFIFAAPIVVVVVCLAALRRPRKAKVMRAFVLGVLLVGCLAGTITMWSVVHSQRGDKFTKLTSPAEREKILSQYKEQRKKYNLGSKQERKMDEKMYKRINDIPIIGWRISPLFKVISNLKDKPSQLLFGLGPGESFAGHFWEEKGKVHDYKIIKDNQHSSILADSGLLGLGIFYWMLIALLWMFIKMNNVFKNSQIRIFIIASIGIWAFYALLGPIYDLVWRHDSSSYIFFFYSAILYKYYYKNIHYENTINK